MKHESKNNNKEPLLILDRSESMSGLESDTIGGAIHHVGNIHKYARPENVSVHTMLVITTDGMENANHRYSGDEVKRMIERQKEKYGWEFLFIGTNIDAIETASHFGIGRNRAVNYRADKQGTHVLYDTVAETVCAMHSDMPIRDAWGQRIEGNNKNRK